MLLSDCPEFGRKSKQSGIESIVLMPHTLDIQGDQMDVKAGRRITELRKSLGFSQERLAECLNVSRQAVARWESDESQPDVGKLVQLSELCHVTIDSILKPEQSCAKSWPAQSRLSTETPDLHGFLVRAKRACYAGKGAECDSCRPASHDLEYREDDLYYRDTYLGSASFAGEEAVWFSDRPVWVMNYMGRVLQPQFSGDFLKICLFNVTEELPIRGPLVYSEGEYTYHCHIEGGLDWFHGREDMYYSSEKIYECLFHGGMVSE